MLNVSSKKEKKRPEFPCNVSKKERNLEGDKGGFKIWTVSRDHVTILKPFVRDVRELRAHSCLILSSFLFFWRVTVCY